MTQIINLIRFVHVLVIRLLDQVSVKKVDLAQTPFFNIYTRVIFYVRRIGLYLYKFRIYGTISIHILKGLASVYQLINILHHLRLGRSRYIAYNRACRDPCHFNHAASR